jgi:branched-chain amino acid transport system substrate-binding protein
LGKNQGRRRTHHEVQDTRTGDCRRSGGCRATGGFANGYADYYSLLNERDGGIEGVKINVIECETAYNTKQGVECYENTKNAGAGALVYQPLSTGITYQLIPKAEVDQIPIFSMGYGRTSAANGKIFPWIFNFPATYWSQATAFIQYIGDQEGGMDKLKGKKIALVHHNSAYGKEPIRTLESMSEKFGYELMLLPVDHPGQEPMDHFIGVWWSGSENDVLPAGEAADGYLSGLFHAPGDGFPAHDDIKKYVYDADKGAGERERIGEVLYNRGLVAAMWTSEAIRNAMKIHNTKELTGAMVRDGLESLKVDENRLEELGLPGFTYAIEISCENHEGPGKVALQRWDAKAKKWSVVTDFYEPLRDVLDPLIKADSEAYAAENNITPRDCP